MGCHYFQLACTRYMESYSSHSGRPHPCACSRHDALKFFNNLYLGNHLPENICIPNMGAWEGVL